jgi:hypothetical protein
MNLSQPTLTYKYNEDVSVGNFSNTNNSELCVCFSKYDLLEQYLMNEVSGSHSCKRLLRVIDYIRRDIYVVDTWHEVIGNGYYITLEKERAIIGLFNGDYLADHSPNSPINIIPYQILSPY